MELILPTFRDGSLFLSLVLFVLTTAAIYVTHRLNGHATLQLKLGLTALWLYSALRIYSASSYLWGSSVPDEAWPFLRAGVLGVLTAILIIIIALLVFYWRRIQR